MGRNRKSEDKREQELYVADKRYHNDSVMAFFYEPCVFLIGFV